ncbi:ATP-binding protein [Verrucomicrobiota bacterium sgz303538]
MRANLPASWPSQLAALYESDAANQFILHGNLQDRFVLPTGEQPQLMDLTGFLLKVLLQRFDIVLSYDLGSGIRVEKGSELFAQWQGVKESQELPRAPRAAIEWLTRYMRYCANLARLGKERLHVACIVKAANLLAPAMPGALNYDLNAMALLLRDWSSEALLAEHTLATFLYTENLSDLHPLLTANPRAAKIKVPLPSTAELGRVVTVLAPRFETALSQFKDSFGEFAAQLTGVSLAAVESLLKLREHRHEALTQKDLVALKRQLVEEECQGLIEFIESHRTLDDLHGQERLKAWLRQDLALWQKGDLRALPMGYLLCGPIGTGKTFLVECLAGEAGVPVVKIKNFRDKWVGSTEGNLEKIFRLLAALERCYVFIDEADQALGRRDSGSNDSGLSGRIYSMIAAEMSRPENRGRIIWILASSRPDLIEVDLKRPGRVDVKLPIFPTATPEESWQLLRAVSKRYELDLDSVDSTPLGVSIPILLTPGAAEAFALKIYRELQTSGRALAEILASALATYQNPIAPEIMQQQISLAISETSDREFVPEAFLGARWKSGNSVE